MHRDEQQPLSQASHGASQEKTGVLSPNYRYPALQ